MKCLIELPEIVLLEFRDTFIQFVGPQWGIQYLQTTFSFYFTPFFPPPKKDFLKKKLPLLMGLSETTDVLGGQMEQTQYYSNGMELLPAI